MKRKILPVSLILTMSLGLFGGIASAASVVQQQEIIVSLVDQWKPEEKTGSYTLTDLDGNGRLEIIASTITKDEKVSKSRLWEINEEGNRLVEYEMPWTQEENQPDLIVKSTAAYYDAENDIRYYIFADETKAEDGSISESQTAIWLKDGVLQAELLVSCQKNYSGETEYTAVYTDADGNEITEEAYAAAAQERFADLEQQEAGFGWVSVKEHPLQDAPFEQIMELAGESCARFLITPAN